jgi:hypothetical protein
MVTPRPSGATIRVVKTFPNKDDCDEQLRLMRSAPLYTLHTERVDDVSFAMPLATSAVPPSAYIDLLLTYERFWEMPSGRASVSRRDYHDYVMSRPGAGQVNIAKQLAANLYSYPAQYPITQRAFVHGDAIISNAVHTPSGVKLIDLSPRPSPSEIELDASKLIFSALGFDMSPENGAALLRLIALIRGRMNDNLLAYYLATHIVRVASKEPPQTGERFEFFNRALHYASTEFNPF